MPTYEYICSNCRDSFDIFQKISDDPLTVCNKCSGKLKKKFGKGAGIIFRGSGFYVTDYKNKKSNNQQTQTPGASGTPGTGTG